MTGTPAREPQETPRIAVVGCGYWGSNLVRNFASLGALEAVHDEDRGVAERTGASAGVEARLWDEILGDPRIDAVAISTPPATHAELAIAALEAGKDVFVEKPLALQVGDAEQVTKTAAATDRVLMVGHLLRYHPAFVELESLVRRGALGDLRYIYSNRLNFGRFRRVENILWSFAPHDISMILSLVGSEPDGVSAISASYLQQEVADVTTTHLSFPGGQAAHVFVSWLHPFKEQKLIVVGDQAMAVFDDGEPWASKLRVYEHEVAWREGVPEARKTEGRDISIPEREPLREECAHFLQCVRQRTRPLTDGQEGTRVLRVLELAERSMRSAEQRAMASGSSTGVDAPERTDGALIHETAVVDQGAEIGAGTRIWHFSHILGGSRIGRDCTIGQNVMIGPEVSIGNRCKIQNNVSLYKGVTLEDGVFCGPSAVFTNVMSPRAEIERKDEFLPTVVRRGASIGANATIVCGNEIGAYSFVGAGAVVVHPVQPHALVVGNPARRIGWVGHHGERLGPDLVCPATGRRYEEREGKLVESGG